MQVAEHWNVFPLGEVLTSIANGLNVPQDKSGIGLPMTRIETIARDKIDPNKVGYVRAVSPQEFAKHRLQRGDILFSHINSEPQIGRAVVYDGIPEKLLHGINLLRLQVNPSVVNSYFLAFVLKYYRDQGVFVGLASRAVGQSSINQGKLKLLEVPVPPLEEQVAIVRALDTAQKAKEVRQRELALERERKAALIEHLFTHGTRGEPTKQCEIGQIPKSWQLSTAQQVCTQVTDGTHDSPRQEPEGFPLVTSVHLKDGRVDFQNAYRISPDEYEKANRRSKVDQYDVLFSMIGSIGAVAFVDEQPSFAIKNVGLLKTGRDPCLGSWLLYWLQNQSFQQWLKSRISGTSQKYVPLWLLRDLPIPVAPVEERDAVVAALRACDKKIDYIEQERAVLDELFRAMLEELMSGRLSAVPLI